jgi:hypothetical protein
MKEDIEVVNWNVSANRPQMKIVERGRKKPIDDEFLGGMMGRERTGEPKA